MTTPQERLKYLRETSKLTIPEAAKFASVARDTYKFMEIGASKLKPSRVEGLCRAINGNPDWVFTGDGIPYIGEPIAYVRGNEVIDHKRFMEIVKAHHGKSLTKIAAKLGVTRSFVSAINTGANKLSYRTAKNWVEKLCLGDVVDLYSLIVEE